MNETDYYQVQIDHSYIALVKNTYLIHQSALDIIHVNVTPIDKCGQRGVPTAKLMLKNEVAFNKGGKLLIDLCSHGND